MARNRYYEDESSREGIDSQLLKRLLQFCKDACFRRKNTFGA